MNCIKRAFRKETGFISIRTATIMAGLIFIFAGLFFGRGSINPFYKYEKGMAKIVGLKPHYKNRIGGDAEYKRNKYAPIVEYTVKDKSYRIATRGYMYARIIKPLVGKTVPIYYDPKNPEHVRVSTKSTKWIMWICLFIGIFLVYKGLRGMFRLKR